MRVLVLGAGFGGIGTAIALLRAGVRDVVVLEAGDGVGGVWRDNTYPGCACDVPAAYYSFSFAPNPHWTRRFPEQPEILAYLQDCADRFGVTPLVRLRTRATSAAWDDGRRHWRVETLDGDGRTGELTGDVLVSAVGQLSRPHVPHLPGVERFTGPVFHSARWRHDVPLAGRRVAVVGTGASAVQFVPRIAGTAAHVTVLQRSAPWTLPKPDRAYGPLTQRVAARAPWTGTARRGAVRLLAGFAGRAVLGSPLPRAALVAASTLQRRVQVRDPALRGRVTPDHPLGCKRMLLTADWLPTLARPDVTLVTDPIMDVGPSAVRTAGPDGEPVEHPADVLVYGTGFAAGEFLAPLRVTGRNGLALHDAWRDGARAHLGLTVPGFPNLFLVYGPNTNTGNTSVLTFEEAQARYVVQAVRHLARTAARGGCPVVEVRADVERRYDEALQARLAGSVWTACGSWYRDRSGRVVANWPGTEAEYLRRTRRFRPEDHATAP